MEHRCCICAFFHILWPVVSYGYVALIHTFIYTIFGLIYSIGFNGFICCFVQWRTGVAGRKRFACTHKQLLVYVRPVNFNTTLTKMLKTKEKQWTEKKVAQLFMANTYDSFSIKLCNFILLISREKQKCHLFIFYEILDLVLLVKVAGTLWQM